MEPEIIRMYSSSPPPLDNVADDDEDDEFGEFGGFAEVNNSGIGFAELDTVNFPKSREDFIPSKHFLPIHDYTDSSVNNFASLTSIKTGENVSEISSSKKGLSSVFESNTNHETTQFNVAALDNKGSSGEIETKLNSETHSSSVDNANLVSSSQDQIVTTCNGEKIHSLENLTNGFTVEESANPQGLQDMDSMGHSKGFKSISSHSTDISIDFSPPSPGDDFAEFATFSSKDAVDLDDTEQRAHMGLHEGQTPIIKVDTKLSRYEDGITSAPTEVLNDPVCQDRVNFDLSSVSPPLEEDTLTFGSVPPTNSMAPETSISDSTHSTDTKTTLGLTLSNKEDSLQSFDGDGSLAPEDSLDRKELALNLKKESENTNVGNISHDQSEYDRSFGDFNAATEESPPPLTDNSESSNSNFHAPLDLDMNELEDDLGDFKEINIGSFHEEQTVTAEKLSLPDFDEEHSQQKPRGETDEFSDFGNFVSLEKKEEWSTGQDSNDFADFGTQPPEWNAFEDDQEESTSWAAFEDQKTDSHAKSDDWQSFRTDIPSSTDSHVLNSESVDLPTFHDSESNLVCEDSTLAFQHSLLGHLERIIQACFPLPSVADIEENISPLDLLLCTEQQEETSKSKSRTRLHPEVLDIWVELQDIHDAFGLKYQWGGSHSNKKLLCSLGIDTRNIFFTADKKHPVIVPMYAAGLGMLEPTKEPLKPLSAAEKIASIGQSSHVPPDDISSSDQMQESLPPVQFDWSSSGLTNPLDASGGSTLLNLDFFGPVDDSGFNSTTTFPGVDPELYALTTSKVECSSASNKVTDAFARLMSTAETTSTSARKPRRDENLSKEAAKVIASLPDLSFMHAKVLMFPVSLTPSTSSQHKVD
ncbi:PREDICTED: aftiphilin isoform X2 [Nanorana parkeri]|uniref:aftiphilin isoform X2 n=1 Tax=Nanorana parkeri TaxID=125878 RepID=UPI000854CBC4|nr:PREDICTED: aftiphilin isoform X2 [Nanorana parkeri]